MRLIREAGRELLRLPGPVFWNELRALFLRNRRTGWVLGGLAAVTALVFVVAAETAFADITLEGDPPGRSLFFFITLLAVGFVAVAAPAHSAGAFIQERDRRTFDLLLSTGLSRFEWILGKMASAFVRTFAGVVAILPAWAVALALGGVSPAEFAFHLLFMASLATSAVALGVMQSMLLSSYALSLLVTYLLLAFVFLASVMITFFAYAFKMIFGVPYPGFWLVTSAVHVGLAFFFTTVSLLLFGRLMKWDY
jgi:ABC-type transport system involved in multi-copper enzyme maturation permease subunit